ncbi:hypothetical protein BDV19DRAFT_373280 [Aspergillus venezuelensis]
MSLSEPFLLYAYPWQPFPRRVIIYLRERKIPSSIVKVVHVSDVQFGSKVPEGFPAKPEGSLPILAIPISRLGNSSSFTARQQGEQATEKGFIYIKQSLAIMQFLEEACLSGRYGFPKLPGPVTLPIRNPAIGDISVSEHTHDDGYDDDGAEAASFARSLDSVRHSELLALASSLTDAWNPIRTFGSGTGSMRIPDAAKEMLGWLHRNLLGIEKWLEEHEYDSLGLNVNVNAGQADNKDNKDKGKESRQATVAEIILYQFLDFTYDCYGVDMTMGSGEKVIDVYGREVVQEYPRLKKFYGDFKTRPSARRVEESGDVPSEQWVKLMTDWSEGIFEDGQRVK